MRILMIITSYHPIVGGAEKQVARLARIMMEMGHEVSVLTRHHKGLATAETIDGIRVRRVAAPGPKPLAAAAFVALAALAISAERPDVIHCHSLFTPALAGSLGKLLTGAPLLAKPMCGGEATSIAEKPLGKQRLAHLGRAVDCFIAVSGEIERELIGLGLPAEKIRRIPNGVDLKQFSPIPDAAARRDLRARLCLPEGTLFIFAGRVAAQKRLPLLLKAWHRTAEAAPDAMLLIAGANRKTSDDKSAGGEGDDTVPAELLKHPQVKLLGHVDDMPSLLRAADAFVLPSAREGMPNALLEACATGLATIAARIGGVEDFVEDGWNGRLFTVDDADSLSRGLTELALDPGLRARIGAAARRTMNERYDIKDTAEMLVSQYGQLCGKSP